MMPPRTGAPLASSGYSVLTEPADAANVMIVEVPCRCVSSRSCGLPGGPPLRAGLSSCVESIAEQPVTIDAAANGMSNSRPDLLHIVPVSMFTSSSYG